MNTGNYNDHPALTTFQFSHLQMGTPVIPNLTQHACIAMCSRTSHSQLYSSASSKLKSGRWFSHSLLINAQCVLLAVPVCHQQAIAMQLLQHE